MNKKDAIKYKDYPEGSSGKKIYDSYFLSYSEYLKKYYANPQYKEWELWNTKYIEPAFDKSRYEEMAKNYGYISIDKHNFKQQYNCYNEIIDDERLPEDVKKFIGFLSGTGFFKKFNISISEWFKMKNWHNPNIENNNSKTINELLNYKYGINYFKILLTQMPYWRR